MDSPNLVWIYVINIYSMIYYIVCKTPPYKVKWLKGGPIVKLYARRMRTVRPCEFSEPGDRATRMQKLPRPDFYAHIANLSARISMYECDCVCLCVYVCMYECTYWMHLHLHLRIAF